MKISLKLNLLILCFPFLFISKVEANESCHNIYSNKGWQPINFKFQPIKVASISGGWSVDIKRYKKVNAVGHSGASAQKLSPYNKYKYKREYPFGALLLGTSKNNYNWVRGPQNLSKNTNQLYARINDRDSSLGDNGGYLKICFIVDPRKKAKPPEKKRMATNSNNSLSPEADRILGQALIGGLGWLFGGGSNSSSSSSSYSSSSSSSYEEPCYYADGTCYKITKRNGRFTHIKCIKGGSGYTGSLCQNDSGYWSNSCGGLAIGSFHYKTFEKAAYALCK